MSEKMGTWFCEAHYVNVPYSDECSLCANKRKETPEPKALDVQVGGGHYKDMAIQPMEYSMKNGLDACQHTAIKYISRFRDKGGIEDLRKAKHVIDMLIQFEEEKGQ